ncbi:DUF3102 domain-containing protein [Globicatella sanguinis]
MNEIQLSNNLRQIELEINWHKENAGKSIWEIGRRLNHVKEKDLVHGEFVEWVESIGITRAYANRYMKVAKELNVDTSIHLGVNALYLIATLPEEAKQEQLQKIEQGETPTVRELQDLKRQLKEKDKQIAALTDSYNELANQPQPTPVVKTIEKEVIPSDYEETKKQLERLTNEHQRLLNERKTVNEKSQRYDELTRFIKEAEGKLSDTQKKIAEFKEVHRLIKESNQFLLKASALSYLDIGRAVTEDPFVKRELESLLSNIERFSKNIKDLTQQSVIEGEIINE